MKNLTIIISAILFVVLLNSCAETQNKELNLADKNIPVTINVPTDTEITESNYIDVEKELYSYVLKSKTYKLLVIFDNTFEAKQTAKENNLQLRKIVKLDAGFEKFILEEDNGYIFFANGNYGFHYSIIKNGKLIEFMETQTESCNEKEARMAYKIAKTAK